MSKTSIESKKKYRDSFKAKWPEHSSWRNMLLRCNDPRNRQYANYGGRGISVCEAWNSFDAFIQDMGRKPSPDHSLERIDVNGNYEPSNCRWATYIEQQRNRRDTSFLELNGEIKPLVEWAEIYGIHRETIRSRILTGWSVEHALTTPSDKRFSSRHMQKKRSNLKAEIESLKAQVEAMRAELKRTQVDRDNYLAQARDFEMELERHATDRVNQRDELDRLRKALESLVKRLDEVHADNRYQSVWIIYAQHGGRYTEPTYTEALETARRALNPEEAVDGGAVLD